MMDVTKEMDDRNSFIHWFLISALCGVKITEETRAHPRILKMTLNGTELNPVHALKRLEEEHNRMVQEEAKSLARERINYAIEPFEEKVRELTEGMNQLIEKFLSDAGAKE